jgi:hypothetical protein
MRAEFRDEAVYPRIDHPEIPTIHPPLAELLFAALASLASAWSVSRPRWRCAISSRSER